MIRSAAPLLLDIRAAVPSAPFSLTEVGRHLADSRRFKGKIAFLDDFGKANLVTCASGARTDKLSAPGH
jgi:hypothetical protein